MQVNPQRMPYEMRIQRPLQLSSLEVKSQLLELDAHEIARLAMQVVESHSRLDRAELDAFSLHPQDRFVEVALRREEGTSDRERPGDIAGVPSVFAASVEDDEVTRMQRQVVLGVVDRKA